MLTIDGSAGEGGGQILRSSLALSMITNIPFRMENIRAKRNKPGLLPQHLAAVQAAARVSSAHIQGAELGSKELTFSPQQIQPGTYHFAIGTAGSATLVLQTILPALLQASTDSHITIEGGTHNPFAPPFEFLDQAFLPMVRKMGPTVYMTLDRLGFYPKGGGRIHVEIKPLKENSSSLSKLLPLDLTERGEVLSKEAISTVVSLPAHIGMRENQVLQQHLGWEAACFQIKERTDSLGPGNYISVFLRSEHITEVVTGIGERGLRGEILAEQVAKEVEEYVTANVPVGIHLADQLLLLLALAGKGKFITLKPSLHTFTQIRTIEFFLGPCIRSEKIGSAKWQLEIV